MAYKKKALVEKELEMTNEKVAFLEERLNGMERRQKAEVAHGLELQTKLDKAESDLLDQEKTSARLRGAMNRLTDRPYSATDVWDLASQISLKDLSNLLFNFKELVNYDLGPMVHMELNTEYDPISVAEGEVYVSLTLPDTLCEEDTPMKLQDIFADHEDEGDTGEPMAYDLSFDYFNSRFVATSIHVCHKHKNVTIGLDSTGEYLGE